jgi:adenylate kinase
VNLILYGAPGSGKGTQAQLLRARFDIPQIATGEILRAESAAGTELGRRAGKIMERGDLVPDEVMIDIVRKRLREPDCDRGCILDGFPRTVPQAQSLDQVMSELGRRFERVLFLKVDLEALVHRLSDRWICPLCARTFSSRANPPAAGNRCREDGSTLIQRDDDRPEAARRRIEVYLRQTLPVLDYYRPRGLVAEIEGGGTIEEVNSRILEQLGVAA